MPVQYNFLTAAQRQHFLEHGWIKIEGAIPPENVQKFAGNAWTRLGMDPNDKSTWTEENIHMPRHREIPTKDFAPNAWKAICELVGGEDRIDTGLFYKSGDSLIVNLGSEYWTTHEQDPREFGNWHIDGDWFSHYLDSGEQGLVVIQLFTDIVPRGGGTYVCEDGIPQMVKWLYDHPEGTNMRDGENGKSAYDVIADCEVFTEFTGKAGDVILCHPFTPHSKSRNYLRNARFITNPPVTLNAPLKLDRSDPSDYSLVEQKILLSLNRSSLPESEWHIISPRTRFPPRTQPGKMARVQLELQRMQDAAKESGEEVDSVHLRGEPLEQWKLNDYLSATEEKVVPPMFQQAPAVAAN